jgi:hypothetical protein
MAIGFAADADNLIHAHPCRSIATTHQAPDGIVHRRIPARSRASSRRSDISTIWSFPRTRCANNRGYGRRGNHEISADHQPVTEPSP